MLGLPAPERERFLNPPVKAILGQLDFLPVADHDGSAFDALVASLAATYPEEIAEGPASQVRTTRRLAARDAPWSVVVSRGSVCLEAGAPVHAPYAELRERSAEIWQTVLRTAGPAPCVKVALRYINHLECADLRYDWCRAINADLLGFLAGPERQSALEMAVSDWLFRLPWGLLVFKHGLLRAGPDDALGYLLDFDGVAQEHTARPDVTALLVTLDAIHETIVTVFRWCVTGEALERFRSRDRRPLGLRSG